MQMPSNGSPAMNAGRLGAEVRVQAALNDAEEGLVRPRVGRQRSIRPAIRPSRGLGRG